MRFARKVVLSLTRMAMALTALRVAYVFFADRAHSEAALSSAGGRGKA